MELTQKELEFLEKHFDIYNNDDCYELEQWTDGGVDMIISLLKDDNRFNNMLEQFKYYVEGFDIDEEIDIYRQNENYKNNFTIVESVKDFESWVEFINNILEEWESL